MLNISMIAILFFNGIFISTGCKSDDIPIKTDIEDPTIKDGFSTEKTYRYYFPEGIPIMVSKEELILCEN